MLALLLCSSMQSQTTGERHYARWPIVVHALSGWGLFVNEVRFDRIDGFAIDVSVKNISDGKVFVRAARVESDGTVRWDDSYVARFRNAYVGSATMEERYSRWALAALTRIDLQDKRLELAILPHETDWSPDAKDRTASGFLVRSSEPGYTTLILLDEGYKVIKWVKNRDMQ